MYTIINNILGLPLSQWGKLIEKDRRVIEETLMPPLQRGYGYAPVLFQSAELIPPKHRLFFFKCLGIEPIKQYIRETGVFSLLFSVLNDQEQHEFSLLLGEGVVKISAYVDDLLKERHLDHHLKLFFLLYALDTETLLQSIKTLKDRNIILDLCEDEESKKLLDQKVPIELFQIDGAAEQLAKLGLHSHAEKHEIKTDLSSSAKRGIQAANQ